MEVNSVNWKHKVDWERINGLEVKCRWQGKGSLIPWSATSALWKERSYLSEMVLEVGIQQKGDEVGFIGGEGH